MTSSLSFLKASNDQLRTPDHHNSLSKYNEIHHNRQLSTQVSIWDTSDRPTTLPANVTAAATILIVNYSIQVYLRDILAGYSLKE